MVRLVKIVRLKVIFIVNLVITNKKIYQHDAGSKIISKMKLCEKK